MTYSCLIHFLAKVNANDSLTQANALHFKKNCDDKAENEHTLFWFKDI